MSLVPSRSILQRARQADGASTGARLGVLERLPGNPVGVAVRQLGDAFAFRTKHLPVFNRVIGLTDDDAEVVADLVAWFGEVGAVGRFEIDPGEPTQNLAAALARAGYYQSGFHAVLFGAPAVDATPSPGVSVEVVGPARLDAFLETYAAGWGIGEVERFKNNVRGWLGQPGWTLYLGRHNGRPAGGAILYLDGEAGYCADSAVDPAQRGHGVHRALLHRRSADAAAAGASLICAQAAYLSTSMRNMIRSGLGLLATKAVWTRAAR